MAGTIASSHSGLSSTFSAKWSGRGISKSRPLLSKSSTLPLSYSLIKLKACTTRAVQLYDVCGSLHTIHDTSQSQLQSSSKSYIAFQQQLYAWRLDQDGQTLKLWGLSRHKSHMGERAGSPKSFSCSPPILFAGEQAFFLCLQLFGQRDRPGHRLFCNLGTRSNAARKARTRLHTVCKSSPITSLLESPTGLEPA